MVCASLVAGWLGAIIAMMIVNPPPGPWRVAFVAVALAFWTAFAVAFPVGSLWFGRTLGTVPFLPMWRDVFPDRLRSPFHYWLSVVVWSILIGILWAVGWRVLAHAL